MREAGAGTNNYSLAHMRRERIDRLEKQVNKNSEKLFKPNESKKLSLSDNSDSENDSTLKIQKAKSVAHEFKKQAMDGAQGSDFSTDLDEYD